MAATIPGRASRGQKVPAPVSMQRRAAPLVDSLEETQRPEADGAVRQRMPEVLDDIEGHGDVQALQHARRALGVNARDHRIELAVHEMDARGDAAAAAGVCAKREENATTAPAIPGAFTASSATVPPCEKPISTVRLAGTLKFVCSRRTRSSTSGSTAATRSRWLSQLRPRVGYQSCATPPRASGSKPLGTTSAALGKRAWNLNAIGIIDRAVAPQPCRKTNRRLTG